MKLQKTTKGIGFNSRQKGAKGATYLFTAAVQKKKVI